MILEGVDLEDKKVEYAHTKKVIHYDMFMNLNGYNSTIIFQIQLSELWKQLMPYDMFVCF